MRPEDLELVRYRMNRAMEALDEADLLLGNNHLHTAVNRLYYACFYSVSALPMTEQMSSPKHSGIRSLLDKFWVKTHRLPKEMGRFYHRLLDMRQESDYSDLVAFAPKDVQGWLQAARQFVTRISEAIDKKIQSVP